MALEDIAKKTQETLDKAKEDVSVAAQEVKEDAKKAVGINMGSGELASEAVREQNLSFAENTVANFLTGFVDFLSNNVSIETSEAGERALDILVNGGSAEDLSSAVAETGMPRGLISAGFLATWSKNFSKGILVGHKEEGFLSRLNNDGVFKNLWDNFKDINRNKKEIIEHNAKLLKEAEKEAKNANDLLKIQREFNFKITQLNNDLLKATSKASGELTDITKEVKVAAEVAKDVKNIDKVSDTAKMVKEADTIKDAAKLAKEADVINDLGKGAKELKTAKDFLDVAELRKFSAGAHGVKTAMGVASTTAKTAAISGVKMFSKNPLLGVISSGLVGFGAYSSYNTAMENKEAIISTQAKIDSLQKEIAQDPNFLNDIRAQLKSIGKDTSNMSDAELASTFLYEFRVVVNKFNEAQTSGNQADIEKYRDFFYSTREKFILLSTLEEKHDELTALMGKDSIVGSFSESSKDSFDNFADSMFSAKGAAKPFCWVVGAGAKVLGYADELQTSLFGYMGKTMAKAMNHDIVTEKTNIDAILDGYHPNAFGFLGQVKGGDFSPLENRSPLTHTQLQYAADNLEELLHKATGIKVDFRDDKTYCAFINEMLIQKGIDVEKELKISNDSVGKADPKLVATIIESLQKIGLDKPNPVDAHYIASVANSDKQPQQQVGFAKVV